MSIPEPALTSVLLVEDHAATALGLQALLSATPGWQVAAHVTSTETAATWLEEHPAAVQLVCLDLGLPGQLDSYSFCAQTLARQPRLRVVVFTGQEDAAVAGRALRAGAHGVVAKSELTPALLHAFTTAMQEKQPYLSPAFRTSATVALTQRQQQVLQLLADGKNNKTIAHELGVGTETVKSHVSGTLARLGARDRTEAVATGLREGLIS